MKASSPSLSNPIEFSIPPAVSIVRGGGFPMRGSGVTVLGMIPPSRDGRTNDCISRVTERTGRDKNWIGEIQAIQRDGEPAQRSRLTSAASISSKQ